MSNSISGRSDSRPSPFHIRHIARSIDRLLTYAEGRQLTSEQMNALKSEVQEGASRQEVFSELQERLEEAAKRILAIPAKRFDDARVVGRRKLPTTVGGLLIHVADHTQRHMGQAITTAKVVVARSS